MFRRWGLFLLTNILVTMTLITVAYGIMFFLKIPMQGYSLYAVFAFVFGFGGAFISLRMSKWMAKRTMNLEEVGPNDRLTQRVHMLAEKAGLTTMPEVYTFNSPEVNAFATGPSRNNSLVAVSTGLINKMSEDQAEAVLAHEVSHIANGDMVTMTLVQGIVNTFVIFITYIVMNIIENALRSDDDGDGRGMGFFMRMIVHNIVYSLFSFLSLPVVMWVSRAREYRADEGAGELVGKHKMISALQALKTTQDTLEKHESQVEVMAIVSKEAILGLISSHPSLDNRIAALQRYD